MERIKIERVIHLITLPLFVFVLSVLFWFYYQYDNREYELIKSSLIENATKINFSLYDINNTKESIANITISREADNIWRIVDIEQKSNNNNLNEVDKCKNYPVSTAYIDILQHLLGDIKVSKKSTVTPDKIDDNAVDKVDNKSDTIASITLFDSKSNKSQKLEILSIVGSHYTEILVKSLEHTLYTDAQLYAMIPSSCIDVASTQLFFAPNFSLDTLTSLNVDFNQYQFNIEHHIEHHINNDSDINNTNQLTWLINGKKRELTKDLEKSIHWFYPILANQLITFDAQNFTQITKIGTIEIKTLNKTYNIDVKQDNNSTYLVYDNKIFTIDEFIFNEVQTAIQSQ